MIRVKRVYAPAVRGDGARFLVDRLWSRAVRKEGLRPPAWLTEVASSGSLRTWFGHDPKRWLEFQRRYRAELDGNPDGWQPLVAAARKGTVTLLFSARDEERNNAVVLKAYVEAKLTDL